MSKVIRSLLMLVLCVSFVAACGGKDTPADTTPTDTAPQEVEIVLFQFKFQPNTVTIPQGTTVVFKNRDQERHNVRIAALNVDENVEPNGTFSYTFSTTGEFAVDNRFSNQPMQATIVVQ